MKPIEIIPLARRKMVRRGINEDLVKHALLHPEQIVEGYGGRLVAHRRLKLGKETQLLRVVYEEKEAHFLVITTYLTSQINRYWKKGEK